MKSKQITTQVIVLFILLLGAIGGYAVGKRYTPFVSASASGFPPVTQLDIPTQTVNGITAKVESYYADGLRFVFVVRLTGENNAYFWDNAYLTDNQNQFVNASYGLRPLENDMSLFYIDMAFESPLHIQQFKGILSFNVSPMMPEFGISKSSSFDFEINFPVKSVLVLEPKQTIEVNQIEMFIEKIFISPAFTQVYLCYNKPSQNDWMIGGSEFIVNSQTATLGTYTLLFDSEYGDTGKGIEPNWSPPIKKGRCVKLGSPIGSENPKSVTLNIFNLQQSMPEAIPEDELAIAREKLLEQGIDMDWQVSDYGNGGGGAGPIYNKLPASISEEEAFQKFMEALGYVHYGPWEFNIKIP